MTTTNTATAVPDNSLPPGILRLGQGAGSTNTSSPNTSGTLAQSDFLKLMTTQLQNQDPLQPMDNGQFLGQMAQFSTVSSLGDMAKQLQGLSDQFVANRMLSSGSLIGRQVLSAGNTAALYASTPIGGSVHLDQAIDAATITIRDASGAVVNTQQMGPAASGDWPFVWDGTQSDGSTAPPGLYRVDVSVSQKGQSQAVTPLLYTPITSVTMQGSDILLNLASGKNVPLTQVTTLR